MKSFQFSRLLTCGLLTCGLVAVALHLSTSPGLATGVNNVFPEGSFENVKIDPGGVTGWWGVTGDKAKIVGKNGEHWLRLENTIAGQSVQTGRRFPLNPEWDSLTVKARIRVENLKPGKNSWETGKIDLEILDANKQPIPSATATMSATATETGWKEFTSRIELPGNAAYLHFITSLWVATGVMEVDDLRPS